MEAIKNIDSYLETHFEVVQYITALRQRTESNQPEKIRHTNTTQGTGGFYELAKELTDKFEAIHKDRQWDGEFFDEIQSFLDTEIYKPL